MIGNMELGWGWSIVVGWLGISIILVLIVWSAVNCRTPRRARPAPMRSAEPTAREILERRYARGELSDEQFEAMRRRLMPPTSAYDMT